MCLTQNIFKSNKNGQNIFSYNLKVSVTLFKHLGSFNGVWGWWFGTRDKFTICKINNNFAWQSKKLHRVTKSTLASETLAVIEAVDAAVLLRLQIQEIYGVIPDIFVYTDSKSLYQTVHTSHVLQDKSVRISVSYLRQFVKNKELKMCWTNSEYQFADTN